MKYRKRSLVIEAVQWKGNNLDELREFVPEKWRCNKICSPYIAIKTLEGKMYLSFGDYLIKGVNGEFYPCKPEIFEKTYDEVGNNSPEDTWQEFCKNRGIPLNTRESTEVMFAWKAGYDRGVNESRNS